MSMRQRMLLLQTRSALRRPLELLPVLLVEATTRRYSLATHRGRHHRWGVTHPLGLSRTPSGIVALQAMFSSSAPKMTGPKLGGSGAVVYGLLRCLICPRLGHALPEPCRFVSRTLHQHGGEDAWGQRRQGVDARLEHRVIGTDTARRSHQDDSTLCNGGNETLHGSHGRQRER